GVPPKQLKTARDMTLVSGNWSDFEKHRDAALVGQALASRRGLKVGQKFSVAEVTVVVEGIFTAANAAEENFLYTDLEVLQRTRGLNSVGVVTQFEVRLREGADPRTLCRT